MNSLQLREAIKKTLSDSGLSYDEAAIEEIMAHVKTHVDYVIGPDKAGETNIMITAEHAKQRNRAGVYG